MTTKLGRRALAGAAALLPAAAFIGSAQAQTANETTFDRVRRTKTLRIAALPGELPYFQKDLASRRMERRLHRHGEGHRQGVRRRSWPMSNPPTAIRCSTCSRTRSISRSR